MPFSDPGLDKASTDWARENYEAAPKSMCYLPNSLRIFLLGAEVYLTLTKLADAIRSKGRRRPSEKPAPAIMPLKKL
jgi:hypothetical protein